VSFFPPGVIADIIAMNESAMPDTCAVHHPTPGAVNPDGSVEPGGEVVTAGVPCRMLAGEAATETLIAMRLTDVASSVLKVPVGTVVAVTDTIAYRGDVYQVLGTNDGQSYATALALGLKKLT
jgi:hypothetical protein